MEMIKKFAINDDFFGRYEKLVKDIVIPYQEKALKDEIEGAEKSHCIENFKLAAEKIKTGKSNSDFYGMVFQDSDVAKWIEGVAYSLAMFPDTELEKRCDEIIDIIGEAQMPDGYLNTYFIVKDISKRWTNLLEAHELYCAGHMIEAAVAYDKCTKKSKLLEIMCKMADHIYDHFITQKAEGYGGHPEIELALMRLYRHTKNEKYLELALHFINVRGVDSDYYIKEVANRDDSIWGSNGQDKEYQQSHLPVREQTYATGHAVRQVYLLAGMADAAICTNDESLKKACRTLWDNITNKKMYITGAIGSCYEGEAFSADYHLPNETAYAETCASIALIFFAQKMLIMEKKSCYANVLERALYNCVLGGMELDGKKFLYVNPLEIIPGISGSTRSTHHALAQRPKWFTCACCPPNVARLLPSIAEYAWEIDNSTVFSHLFIGGILDLTDTLGTKINVKTNYPYDSKIIYNFTSDVNMTLAIRLPDWSFNTAITKNNSEIEYTIKDGYAYITDNFKSNDEIVVDFDMSVKTIFANENVNSDNGKVAFLRGPLVYCAEGIDNDNNVLGLRVLKNTEIKVNEYNPNKLEGICEIKVSGVKTEINSTLYSYKRPEQKECEITLIPYYAWGNRGLSQMRVWIPEK